MTNKLIGLDESGFNRDPLVPAGHGLPERAANLNPVHRIIDQVAEPLIQHCRMKRTEANKQAREALQGMGLPRELGHRFPHELSGGEIQRVLLAMAADPGSGRLIVLDEPTAALDAMTKSFVAHVIREPTNQGKAVLLITHDLDLAGSLADDLAVLYLGQIMETMPARELFETLAILIPWPWARSYPSLDATRDLGGIRGDAFYRVMHAHARNERPPRQHSHIAAAGTSHETVT